MTAQRSGAHSRGARGPLPGERPAADGGGTDER